MSSDGGSESGRLVLHSVARTFEGMKHLADRAIAQLDDEELRRTIGPDQNSVAVIMKHLAGNMCSRWTDFLTTDGEKPDRHRDQEFIDAFASRDEILESWERGWACVREAMASIDDDDLATMITIRGEPHSVLRAIHRQVSHYAYHIGQIVLLARQHRGAEWRTLSIPRGESETFNRNLLRRPPEAR